VTFIGEPRSLRKGAPAFSYVGAGFSRALLFLFFVGAMFLQPERRLNSQVIPNEVRDLLANERAVCREVLRSRRFLPLHFRKQTRSP
jgi:hypothetical protein